MDIAEARKAQGVTQAQLAKRLQVTQATVSRWETGQLIPSERDLIAIRVALDEVTEDRAA